MSSILSLCVPALGATTPVILSRVDAVLCKTRFEKTRDSVQIALAEVLNNVIEHGYRDASAGAVAVSLSDEDGVLRIMVTDWGHAYPDHTVPDGTLPDPTEMSEGGYGWFLIKTLMTDVTYERQLGANHLSLRLAV